MKIHEQGTEWLSLGRLSTQATSHPSLTTLSERNMGCSHWCVCRAWDAHIRVSTELESSNSLPPFPLPHLPAVLPFKDQSPGTVKGNYDRAVYTVTS